MVIAVTGGTGFLGTHTVSALLRRGERVRLLARDPARVPDGVDVVVGDVTDPEAVASVVDGASAVLHAAGLYSFDSRRREDLWRTNVLGTQVVLDAANVPVVHVSTVGTRFVSQPREAYLASKVEAERIARRRQAEGAPVTITYPPALLGPADPYLGDQNARLRDLLRGLMPIWPSGGLPLGDVRDSAEQHARILTGELSGPEFFGPATFLSMREFLAAVREVTGRRLPAVFLPARAMFPIGRLADALQRVWPWHIPAQYGALYVCAVAVAGPAPVARPIAETLHDTVAWLRATGALSGRQAGRVPALVHPARRGKVLS